MAEKLLRHLTRVWAWVIALAVLSVALFAGYALWDNFQIYQSARNVQSQIRQLKPQLEEKHLPNFDELRAINPDVVGWLTLPGTNVDYPVLQGKTNHQYMNRDVYGEFSMAGSIFMDVRSSANFSGAYTLIYGHNMDEHLMFGDLTLYKDREFFAQNTKAEILTPKKNRKYNVLAVMQISAGTEQIFNADYWGDNLTGMADFLRKNSIWYHKNQMDLLSSSPAGVQVVALATCSGGGTNNRTVLLLIKKRQGVSSNIRQDTPDVITPGGNIPQTGDSQSPMLWILLIGAMLALILIVEIFDHIRRKRRRQDF